MAGLLEALLFGQQGYQPPSGGLLGGMRGALDQIAQPGLYAQQRLQNDAMRDYRQQVPGLFGSPFQVSQPQQMAQDFTVPVGTTGGAGTPNYGSAIASIESGGKYDILGPVTKTGDRAYGKYQVMGANIGPWSREILGQEVTPQQFLSNPEIQDKIFEGKFGQYAQKHGPNGAARAWFAGEGGMNDMNRKDQLGTSVASYGQKFDKALGGDALPANAQPASGQVVPSDNSARVARMVQILSIPNLPDGPRKAVEALLSNELANTKTTDDIKEFEFAKRQGFTGTLEQWMQRKRSGAGEYGLQPIWGTDPITNQPALIQLGKSGEAIRSKIPDGIQVGKDVIRVDAGTHTILLDPVTRQPIGQISKNIEETQAAEKRGAATGAAQVDYPGAVNTAKYSLDIVDSLIGHPGRETGTGLSSKLDPRNYIAGTDATNFRVKAEQLQGRVFLEAFDKLRGAGAITEQEGRAATQAMARLNTAQSDTEYVAALRELRGILVRGMAVAQQRASGNFGAPANQSQAQPGVNSGSDWINIGNGVRIREKR